MYVTRAFTLGVALLTSGCVSLIDVKQAKDGSSEGIHYYLPQVFIEITPNTDGSFKVETVYLPDPTKRYAINAHSYLGSFTIDINRSEQGFLETVSFNSDNTGIAKQLISTEATLRATEIDAQSTKNQKEAAEVKAASDKQLAKLAAAEEAHKQALVSLQVAQAKLSLLEGLLGAANAPSDLDKQILAAQLVVAEAKVKYDATTLVANTEAQNFLAANGAAKGPALTAMSPAFLKVSMTDKSVTLKQMFDQKELPSWKIPVISKAEADLEVRPVNQVIRPDSKTQALTVSLRANKLLRSIKLVSLRELPSNAALDPTLLVGDIQFDQSTILIDFPNSMKAGDYQIRLDADAGTVAKPDPKSITVKVRIERQPI